MTEELARFLVSEPGQALLARGARALTNDRTLSPEHRAAALSVLEGRERAARRGWQQAEQLFLTADSVAQASSDTVAAFHARCFAEAHTVLDACCGIGRDSLALAQAGKQVTAVDTDPARLVFARANAELLGLAAQLTFVCADATALEGRWDGAFFDPARRDGTGRFSYDAERYQPPLTFLDTLRSRCQTVVAKLSPALPDSALTERGGALTFLSEERTCKEACVVLGGLSHPTRALLLPEGVHYDTDDDPPVASQPGAFLLDPDPAILRAGALGALARQAQALRLSADDAYLTSEEAQPCPGARSYRIHTCLPYRERTLGRWLREQGIGRLVVKKRRYPKEPADVHKELGLKGKGAEATLVIVATGKSWLGIVCEPVSG